MAVLPATLAGDAAPMTALEWAPALVSGHAWSPGVGHRRPPRSRGVLDSLAQFYRRAYLRRIDATKRRPEQRPLRIAEMIRLLEAGHKQRPHQ